LQHFAVRITKEKISLAFEGGKKVNGKMRAAVRRPALGKKKADKCGKLSKN